MARNCYYLHNDIDTGDTVVDGAANIATAASFQAGTPKLLFRMPMSPQGNPGQWKNVTKDGREFIFTVPVTGAWRVETYEVLARSDPDDATRWQVWAGRRVQSLR